LISVAWPGVEQILDHVTLPSHFARFAEQVCGQIQAAGESWSSQIGEQFL